MEKGKTLIQSFYNFLEDPDGLTSEDLIAELQEQGIDVSKLEKKVAEIVKKGSAKRRLAWRENAQQRRAEIENLLKTRQVMTVAADLKAKLHRILAGNYGQDALSYAEAYFRKKDILTDKDLESLIEDLEDLNFLDKSDKEDK
jgi:hypothetical protein